MLRTIKNRLATLCTCTMIIAAPMSMDGCLPEDGVVIGGHGSGGTWTQSTATATATATPDGATASSTATTETVSWWNLLFGGGFWGGS
ncbi:MAG: hypothetical protein JXQ75_23410 [Phycisphaerae bacterium]|nr:hypothetical protein [Phycisphaerae bacterium]